MLLRIFLVVGRSRNGILDVPRLYIVLTTTDDKNIPESEDMAGGWPEAIA